MGPLGGFGSSCAILAVAFVLGASGATAATTQKVAVVGDIACPPGEAPTATTCRHEAVAAQIARSRPDSLWLLGDLQYPAGALADFRGSFEPALGRFRRIWRPSPGNHEYLTPGAAGYFEFFGRRAGPARRGYYSFNVGRWHVVSLNSNCEFVGCDQRSKQAEWLKSDLARRAGRCTAAIWHHPLYSSGKHGDNPAVRPLWRILQQHGTELVLSGHDHNFEIFRRQDAHGRHSSGGIRQFVVGIGGKSAKPFANHKPNSLLRRTNIFGFLSLRLGARSYRWNLIDETGTRRAGGGERCS